MISPVPTNLILKGNKGKVFDIKKGIYVTNIWYTRFQNYVTGDFSTIPRDGMFLIEDGLFIELLKVDIEHDFGFPYSILFVILDYI